MHIGLNEFMEGAPKAKKKSEKQLLHLAKKRQQKALKREQTKSTQAQTPLPSAPQQNTIHQNQQHQPYDNLKTSVHALAGSIPTEFGELINLTDLSLRDNQLSGTPSLLILPGVVVRVYHLRWQGRFPRNSASSST